MGIRFILASASPRRKELLKEIVKEFEIIPANSEEICPNGLIPSETVMFLAKDKAEEVFSRCGGVVLGADTIVVFEGGILGKPKDEKDAFHTLKRLSGKAHEVITGICLINGGIVRTACCTTKVLFNKLDDNLITEYVNSGLAMDKAGSYGIQDGFPLVKSYEGSYTNIVGLPKEEVIKLLKEEGLWEELNSR